MIALPGTIIRNIVYNELTKAKVNELLMMHRQLDLAKSYFFHYLEEDEVQLPHIDIKDRYDTFIKRDDIFCVPAAMLRKQFDYLLVFSRWQRVGREMRSERVNELIYHSMPLDSDKLLELRNAAQTQKQTTAIES